MDVSKYSFLCQKALHQGLQYAKSFGHQYLEVEHVALALLRAECLDIGHTMDNRLQEEIRQNLSQMQKVFGNVTIKFGIRLDRALDHAEDEAGGSTVDEETMWAALVRQSTLIQKVLARENELNAPEPSREPAKGKKARPSGDQDAKLPNREKSADKKAQKESGDKEEETLGESYKIPEKNIR